MKKIVDIINEEIEEKRDKDFAPIEDTPEWINIVNDVKRKYNVDGMHIINYEMDYPTVVIYKWGFQPFSVWNVLKSYKILLSKKSRFRDVINFLTRKIQKEDWSIKWHFANDGKMYETMKKTGKQRLFEVMERLNPDFQQRKPRLILPVGISGSGKSTWIKSQTDQNTVVVSPDEIRRELTGNISDQTKNNEVFALANKRAADALNAGKNVIFDATNIASRNRKGLMDYMKVHVEGEFDAVAKIFNIDPEIAKQRIKKDVEAGVDRSNVPDYAIDRQYQTFTNDVNLLEPDGFKIID